MIWQPIATAPMDSTRILVAYRRRVYTDDTRNKQVVREAYRFGGLWRLVTGYELEGNEQPTHWMPLPDPPSELTLARAAAERNDRQRKENFEKS